jgi:hypothetical protein
VLTADSLAEQMVGNSVGTMVEKKVRPMAAMMAEWLVGQ